jgi:hypothetical protein
VPEPRRPEEPRRDPTVTVAVCTTGAPGRMAALSAQLAAVLDASPETEALVVDNSRDGGLTMDDPRIRVVRCALPGLSRARTAASALARADVLVFTDDDVEFGPSWPALMAAPLLTGTLDATAAPIRLGPEYDALDSPLLRGWLAEGNLDGEVRMIGAGMALHRRVLGLGLWDERLGAGRPDFAFGEESLFELMIRAAGARVGVVPEAGVVHHPDPARSTHEHLVRMARQKGLSDAYLGYHWYGDDLPRPRLRARRRALRLWWHRVARRTRGTRDIEELRLAESLGRAEGHAMLQGESRAYLPRPLAS